jgi:hypothetical protein
VRDPKPKLLPCSHIKFIVTLAGGGHVLISRLKSPTRTVFLYADRLRRGGLYRSPPTDTGIERHLLEAVEWLKRAQDAGTDKGVSYGADFGG